MFLRKSKIIGLVPFIFFILWSLWGNFIKRFISVPQNYIFVRKSQMIMISVIRSLSFLSSNSKGNFINWFISGFKNHSAFFVIKNLTIFSKFWFSLRTPYVFEIILNNRGVDSFLNPGGWHTKGWNCRKGSQTFPRTLADAQVKKGDHV